MSHRLALATLLLLLASCSRGLVSTPQIGLLPKAQPTAWSNSFGDSAHTRRAKAIGPSSGNVAWTYDMDIGGAPVFAPDGRSFFSSGRMVVAYSPEGVELWRYRLANPSRGLLLGHDQRLYLRVPDLPYNVHSHGSTLLALDLSGGLMWSAQLDPREELLGAAHGVVFTSYWEGDLRQLRGYREGERSWATDVYGDWQHFVHPDGFAVALSLEQTAMYSHHYSAYGLEGEELWSLPDDLHLRGGASLSLAPDGSMRAVASTTVDRHPVDQLVAISAAGAVLWRSEEYFSTYDERVMYIAADGSSYVHVNDGPDYLLAVDPHGERLWSAELPDYDFTSVGATRSGLTAIVDYAGSENWAHPDKLVAISTAGELSELREIPNSYQRSAKFLPDRIIYSGRWLLALRPDGSELWRHAWGHGGSMIIGPGDQLALFEGLRYNTAEGDSLTVLSRDGAVDWRYKLPDLTGWFRLEATADTSGYLVLGNGSEQAPQPLRLNVAGTQFMEFSITRPPEYPYPYWNLGWVAQADDGSLQAWDGYALARYTPTGQRELYFGEPTHMQSAEGGAAIDAEGRVFVREFDSASQRYGIGSYDSAGIRRWFLEEPSGNKELIADGAGGVYLVGAEVIRVDQEGAILWAHEYQDAAEYYGGKGALRADGSLVVLRFGARAGWGSSARADTRAGSDVAPSPPPGESLLYALSGNGEKLWEWTVSGLVEDGNESRLELGRPVVDPVGNIYVCGMQGCYSLSPDGVERWRVSYPHTEEYAGPVIDATGRLYFSADHRIYAVGP